MRNLFICKWHISVICILSIALGFSLAANYYNGSLIPKPIVAAQNNSPSLTDGFVYIADALAPSVVTITSEKTVTTQSYNPFGGFEDFFGFNPFGNRSQQQRSQVQQSVGSGVIVRSDGYIITNNHVVAGADRVTVRLYDGNEYDGTALVDPRTDLALIKIDADNLKAASFADSDKLRVGEWAIAIGTPFRLKNTLTVGVVSAIRTDDPIATENTYMQEYLQTDASINPGNSGGPLVNANGEIIGINFMIYSKSGGNMGIGFAIPSNTVKYVMNELIENGRVVRGYLGLVPADMSEATAKKLGVTSGVLVESIEKNTPAYEAGIRIKDVIVKIGKEEVKTSNDLRNIIQKTPPGMKVDIVVIRNKKQQTFNVEIGEMQTEEIAQSGSTEAGQLGIKVSALSDSMRKRLQLDEDITGVLVADVNAPSAASRSGIKPGDVICEIDDTAIKTVADFRNVTKNLKKGETIMLVIYRGGRQTVVDIVVD